VLKVAKDNSAPFKYKASVPFTGGSATLDWNEMANTPVTGSDRPDEPEFYIVTFDGYEQAGEQRRWRGFVGDIIERPIDPTRVGFIFDDWYADASFTTLYKFDSPVTKDTTLYAKWIAVTESEAAASAAKEEADEETPVAILTGFTEVLVSIAKDAGTAAKTYTLPIGSETYVSPVTLTTANSPASVTINGSGSLITGNANRITVGAGVTLALRHITFRNILLDVESGGSLVLDTGAVVSANAGTGVTVNGTLVMNNGASVRDNNASGVVLGANAVFTMTGGSISGNVASVDGGGVAIDGENSVFNMTGGSISENIGRGNGGGVAISGENGVFNMTGGIISNNLASTENGGGVHILSGCTFNMTGGVITGNAAVEGNGGGVFIEGTFTGDPSIGANISVKGAIYHNVPDDLWQDGGLEQPDGTTGDELERRAE
jgi:uncharacterized repeat protein (TIGR02543 family)